MFLVIVVRLNDKEQDLCVVIMKAGGVVNRTFRGIPRILAGGFLVVGKDTVRFARGEILQTTPTN